MLTKLFSRNTPDLIGALFTIGVGIFTLVESTNYRLGTINSMGPGYFPQILSWLLIILGGALLIITLLSKEAKAPLSIPNFFSILAVGIAILSFGLIIENHGLMPAIFSAVFISTLASKNINILRSLFLSLITASVCTFVFIYVLGLPIKVIAL